MARWLLLTFALLGTAGGSARGLGGYGLSVSLPPEWHGLAAPGQLQAADFPLSRNALASAARACVGRGHVQLIVWDTGPSVPYLTQRLRR